VSDVDRPRPDRQPGGSGDPPATLPEDELRLPHFEDRLLAALAARQREGAWRTNGTGRWPASPPAEPDARDGAGGEATGAAPDAGGPVEDDASVVWPIGAVEVTDPERDAAALVHVDWTDERPRRRGRGRAVGLDSRRRVLTLAAVAASLLVVALAVSAVVQRDGGRADVGTGGPSTTTSADAGAVQQQIVATLEEALDSSIVHSRREGGQLQEEWIDQSTGAERHLLPHGVSGQPLDRGRSTPPDPDEEPFATPTIPRRDVNYCRREYADTMAPALTIGSTASAVGSSLSSGWLRLDGTEVVDGRELLRFVEDTEAMSADLGAGLGESQETVTMAGSGDVTYVDPETNLPVLIRHGDRSTTTIEYLPRTPENLALLVPPIPEGFTRVDAPATDDEVAALGCR
jgi:hypothetical protein